LFTRLLTPLVSQLTFTYPFSRAKLARTRYPPSICCGSRVVRAATTTSASADATGSRPTNGSSGKRSRRSWCGPLWGTCTTTWAPVHPSTWPDLCTRTSVFCVLFFIANAFFVNFFDKKVVFYLSPDKVRISRPKQ